MVGNKLDYKEYKTRFDELYPGLSEEEKLEIFNGKVKFWKMMIENREHIKS